MFLTLWQPYPSASIERDHWHLIPIKPTKPTKETRAHNSMNVVPNEMVYNSVTVYWLQYLKRNHYRISKYQFEISH